MPLLNIPGSILYDFITVNFDEMFNLSVPNKFQYCMRWYYFELRLGGSKVTPDCALLGAAEQHHINVQDFGFEL